MGSERVTRKTVALELQPLCGMRSGIGSYTYEVIKRLRSDENIQFVGELFNYRGRNDNTGPLTGIECPIRENRLMPYGIYRRAWDVLPLRHEWLFPGDADTHVFFNYIVPPHIGGRIINTVYDMTIDRFPETMDERNRVRLRDGLRRSVERSDAIITISEFSRNEIVECLGYPAEQIFVAPCAPSFTDECTDEEDLRARFGLRKPYILYVGTIEPRKNLVRLIHAFEKVRTGGIDCSLVLAGGNGWNNEEIYAAAEASPYRDAILFTGFVTQEDKNALYKGAAVFAFPSLYEGFGMPPLEAMHFGTPVVCSRAASLPEVVGKAALMHDAADEKKLAECLCQVLTEPETVRALCEEGKAQVQKFRWENTAEKVGEVCRKL